MATFKLPEAWQCDGKVMSYPKVDEKSHINSIHRIYVETIGYEEAVMSLRKAYMLENPHYGDYLNDHVNDEMGGLNVDIIDYFKLHILTDVHFEHKPGAWGWISNTYGYPFNFGRVISQSEKKREIFFNHKL